MSCDNRGCGYSRWNLVPVEVNDLICCWFHWIYSFTFCSVNVYLKHPLVYKHFSREDKLWLWNKSSWNCLLSFVTAVVFDFIPKMKSVQFLFLIFFWRICTECCLLTPFFLNTTLMSFLIYLTLLLHYQRILCFGYFLWRNAM